MLWVGFHIAGNKSNDAIHIQIVKILSEFDCRQLHCIVRISTLPPDFGEIFVLFLPGETVEMALVRYKIRGIGRKSFPFVKCGMALRQTGQPRSFSG